MSVATAVAIIGAVVGAGSAVSQGQAAKKQSSFQANVARQQAESERLAAAEQERDYRKAQSSRLAQIRASMGASGTDTSTGTPLLALADFEGETERNALRIRSGGEIRSRRLDELGGFYNSAGKTAESAGYGRAGSSLLSGIAGSFK